MINGRHVVGLIVRSDNGLFAVDPEDMGVGMNLRRSGEYGAEELARISSRIHSDSRVLVVGAHVGTLALPISKLCREVIAIEANPHTYEYLSLNIKLNDAGNCRAFNVAAGSCDETIEFLLSRANSGGSKRVPRISSYLYYYDRPQKVSVESVRLDTYLEDTNFDTIIMDIEGSEYFALQGMQEILRNAKTLVIEFIPHHLRNVSGASVQQFVDLISPHFAAMTVPSRGLSAATADFSTCLSEMYRDDREDPGLIFEKA